jgi:hypothetical protein
MRSAALRAACSRIASATAPRAALPAGQATLITLRFGSDLPRPIPACALLASALIAISLCAGMGFRPFMPLSSIITAVFLIGAVSMAWVFLAASGGGRRGRRS